MNKQLRAVRSARY